jgi:predicted transposase/invertase (TIGR01784 family)
VEKSFGDLKHSWQIALIAKQRFFPDESFFHIFEYYDPVHKVSLGGRSRIITVELTKLEQVVEKPIEEMTEAELWAVFFRYLTDPGKRRKINEIVKRERGIAMASRELLNISKDEIERAWALSAYKYELDTQSLRVDTLREGREQGRTEGRLEVAKNLIKLGLPPEQVAEATKLDLQTIKNLGK